MSRGGRAGGRGVAVPVAPAGSVRTQRAAGAVTSLERHWRRVAPSAALEFSVSLPRSILAQKRGFPPSRTARQRLGGGGGARGCWDRPGRWEAPLDAAGRELGELLAANRESLERGSMAQGRRHASGRVRAGVGTGGADSTASGSAGSYRDRSRRCRSENSWVL